MASKRPPEATRGPEIFPETQRADGGLEQLLRTGRISLTVVPAGKRFVRDNEFGFHGASDPDRRLRNGRAEDGVGYSTRDRFESARVDANTRWREASQAVGKRGTELLLAFCVKSLSIRAIARRLGSAKRPARALPDFGAP